MQKKKKVKNYSKSKRAFDSVMSCYRKFLQSTIGAAPIPGAGGGKGTPNPAKPSVVDYRADVLKAVKARLPKDVNLSRFLVTYVLFDSDDSIEMGRYAQIILGDRRHSVEQRLGEEFVSRGLYPAAAYFKTIRTGGVHNERNKI